MVDRVRVPSWTVGVGWDCALSPFPKFPFVQPPCLFAQDPELAQRRKSPPHCSPHPKPINLKGRGTAPPMDGNKDPFLSSTRFLSSRFHVALIGRFGSPMTLC